LGAATYQALIRTFGEHAMCAPIRGSLMGNPGRPAIKDITEARDKVGKLTPEMIRNATVEKFRNSSNGFGDPKEWPPAAVSKKGVRGDPSRRPALFVLSRMKVPIRPQV
jgi:hypothetical protein